MPHLRRAQALFTVRSLPGPALSHADGPETGSHGGWAHLVTPRFKGKLNFDFSLPCPACTYKIQPYELVRLAAHQIKCPNCGAVFDEMAGRKPLSTS
jgi:hypothetical protein